MLKLNDDLFWRCRQVTVVNKRKKKCDYKRSLKYNTFFNRSKLSIGQICEFVLMWLDNCSGSFIRKHAEHANTIVDLTWNKKRGRRALRTLPPKMLSRDTFIAPTYTHILCFAFELKKNNNIKPFLFSFIILFINIAAVAFILCLHSCIHVSTTNHTAYNVLSYIH